MEAPLYSNPLFDPSAPNRGALPAYWVGPRHLAGDNGHLYDAVADTLADLGWTSFVIVRGRDEAPEDRQVLRSTVLHISPDTLRWAQWVLPDEPFHLGGLPIAWQVSARSDASSPLAEWSAYFTPCIPGEVLTDFVVALDECGHPTAALTGPEVVLDAVTAQGWLRDADEPHSTAMHPTFTSRLSLSEVPPLIQDADPRVLATEPDEPGPLHGRRGLSPRWPPRTCGLRRSVPACRTTSSPHSPHHSVPPHRSSAGCDRRARGTASCVPRPAENCPAP